MGSHSINLIIRFLLELAAFASPGIWGWEVSSGWLQIIPGFGIPIGIAAVWGIFAGPNGPSRSGAAPVVTPGIIRLVIELTIFAFATWALYDVGYPNLSLILGIIVTVLYIVSYDRIKWLLSQ